ncbi:MAG: energy transducer TonB [Thermodesulfobacteriota bacterium]|nr:energy transducer TonB [Thermodesulfobacteriota bacterium]
MKRILIAAIIAVGIHWLFLGIEFDRTRGGFSEKPKSRIVTMTLVSRQPKKSESKPVANKHVPVDRNKKKAEKKKLLSKPEKKKHVIRSSNATNIDDKKKKTEPPIISKKNNLAQEPAKDILKDRSSVEAKHSFSDSQGFNSVKKAIPIYDKNPSPEYPLIARRRGFQGTVVLEVMVKPNGRVGDLKVFKSSGYKVLDRAASVSVRDWIFKPAIKGNEKIEMWVRVPVYFQLK